MSLLFEHAVDQFSLDSATLRSASQAELSTTADTIPVRPIAEFAAQYDSLHHPDEGWICIPLHGPNDAIPRNEYIAYTNHNLRGELFLVDRDGESKTVPADEFGRTELANHIRFWHSDYLPESVPPGYDSPIADHEPPRNPVDPEQLVDGLLDYIAAEQTATKATHRERAGSQSARTIYQQGGAAIPSLTCRGKQDGAYQFRVQLNESLETRRDGDWAYFIEGEFGIYQGNEVLLHATDDRAPDEFPIAATVEKIRGLNLWVTIDWTAIADSAIVNTYLERERTVGLSELLNPVPFDREREAIEALRDDDRCEVLAGERDLTFSNTAAARSQTFDSELNQEQQQAANYALLADDLFCIHGPPGTGKTRTLIEIIRRAVDAGETVLVCADSNQALDNLVAGSSLPDEPDERSLHAYSQHGTGEFVLERVNAERSSHAVVREQYQNVAAVGDVVAATNSSAATLARDFDVLVLDEATQSTCTASCIPLTRANRFILAGDHHQLPPFSATDDPPASSYGLSLFEHLYAEGGVYEGVGIQLRTQYRMHRDIASFSNRTFYDRQLRNGKVIEPLPDHDANEGYNVGGAVEVIDHSRANKTEGELVIHLVQQLLTDVAADEIGIITPYAAQVQVLRQLLTERTAVGDRITVDTIDAFQGSEKTAIIVSLVRSNEAGDIGFLGRPEDGPRRLNVALTRAKRYCAIVADFHTLRYDAPDKRVEVYRDLYDYFQTTGRLKDVQPEFLSL